MNTLRNSFVCFMVVYGDFRSLCYSIALYPTSFQDNIAPSFSVPTMSTDTSLMDSEVVIFVLSESSKAYTAAGFSVS